MNARDRWAWLDGAACVGKDPAIFFPVNEANPEAKALAKSICQGCPVKNTCLHTAFHDIAGPRVEGVWGNATGLERDATLKIVASRKRARAHKAKGVDTPDE